MDTELLQHLKNKAQWVRRKVLDMAVKANSGHVSTAFSQAEMLVALYHGGILKHDPKNPKWPERDRFILSKGQGGIGLYPVLADRGYFPLAELDRFAQRDGILGVHAEWNISGVEVLTGSLGHGLPIASGMAEAARLNKQKHKIFVMTGDAELAEGSNWEALLTIGTRQYENLVIIVDRNGQGTIGMTDPEDHMLKSDGPRLDSLDDKFESFGVETVPCDGHDFGSIFSAFDFVLSDGTRPWAIISNTKKGRGASVMEDIRLRHYWIPQGEDLEQTKKDLEMK